MSKTSRSVALLVTGIVIFVGLPLLAWGLDDVQGFFAQFARMGYILLVVALQTFVVFRFPQVGQNQREGTKTVERQRLAIVLIQPTE